MTTYIWYSSATDVTGQAFQEALNIEGTREQPNLRRGDILIGWGTKIQRNVDIIAGVKILNHPNAIRKCRNKFEAMKMMNADRNMAQYTSKVIGKDGIKAAVRAGDFTFPIVGRKNFHQGGKDFWLCLTTAHLDAALGDGAQYFRGFMDIKTEYRLHVFDGKVIYAVKKAENASEEGWAAQRKEKVMDYANKNNVQVDEATLNYVLGRLAKEVQLPNRIIRSNKMGWKFSSVRLNNLSRNLKDAAIGAVGALGLDFGAVDCATLQDNTPSIIEVNSGPGCQGTTHDKYIEAFTAKIAELNRPARRNRNRQAAAEEEAPAPQNNRRRNAAAGADVNPDNINPDAMRHLMNAVNGPDEARRVLDLIMGQR